MAERVREAVMKSDIAGENIDYLLGAQYIALNWMYESVEGAH